MAAKIAYVATARVEAVLSLLVGASERNRIRAWAADAQALELARRQFELSGSDAKALCLRADVTDLEQRQHISLALRWCPTCLGKWYHSARFQDTRIRMCPWHGERLRDSCSNCARAIDPLDRPWRCGHCGKLLAANPEKWLSDFKVAPGHAGTWPTRLSREILGYEERPEGTLCFADPDGEQLLSSHARALDYWQHAQLSESAACLWDTVLRHHRDCALHEPYGYYKHYYVLEFKCPVAAAARAVFGQMNLDSASAGSWPTVPVTQTAYQTLPAAGSVSLEVRRAMLRELPRAWLADALLLLGEVSRAGRTTARWEPHPDAFQSKTVPVARANQAELVTRRPESWIAATAHFSGALCPNGKAFTGHWDAVKLLLV